MIDIKNKCLTPLCESYWYYKSTNMTYITTLTVKVTNSGQFEERIGRLVEVVEDMVSNEVVGFNSCTTTQATLTWRIMWRDSMMTFHSLASKQIRYSRCSRAFGLGMYVSIHEW